MLVQAFGSTPIKITTKHEVETQVGEVKTRLWLVYLGGCSITFQRNGMKIYQTLVSHKRKGQSGLPPTRADLYRNAQE